MGTIQFGHSKKKGKARNDGWMDAVDG